MILHKILTLLHWYVLLAVLLTINPILLVMLKKLWSQKILGNEGLLVINNTLVSFLSHCPLLFSSAVLGCSHNRLLCI